jgi:chromosome segregation ATPase
MGAAHQAIQGLQNKFTLHVDDLGNVEATRKRLDQLEVECRDKDDELVRREHTITTLTRMDQKLKDEIERKREDLEKDKQELVQERAKVEKRVAMKTAEERLQIARDLEGLTKKHTENYEKLRKELEDELAQKRDGNDRRVTVLEAENERLSTTVKKQKKTIETQAKELEKTTEQCDVLERAKNSVKKEKQTLEEELEMLKKEFALNSKSKDYL